MKKTMFLLFLSSFLLLLTSCHNNSNQENDYSLEVGVFTYGEDTEIKEHNSDFFKNKTKDEIINLYYDYHKETNQFDLFVSYYINESHNNNIQALEIDFLQGEDYYLNLVEEKDLVVKNNALYVLTDFTVSYDKVYKDGTIEEVVNEIDVVNYLHNPTFTFQTISTSEYRVENIYALGKLSFNVSTLPKTIKAKYISNYQKLDVDGAPIMSQVCKNNPSSEVVTMYNGNLIQYRYNVETIDEKTYKYVYDFNYQIDKIDKEQTINLLFINPMVNLKENIIVDENDKQYYKFATMIVSYTNKDGKEIHEEIDKVSFGTTKYPTFSYKFSKGDKNIKISLKANLIKTKFYSNQQEGIIIA